MWPIEQPVLICDIGGGSVEFILADARGVCWKQSLEIGAQRLLDSFHHSEPMAPAERDELRHFLSKQFAGLSTIVETHTPQALVGTAGTFDTLRELSRKGQGIADASSPIYHLPETDYRRVHQQLLTLGREDRLALPGMHPQRVELIVSASCIVEYLLDSFGFAQLLICRTALKEGIMHRMWQTNQQAA